ncbi:MAG: hypothetical protein WCF33_00485 [Pseudonocardiaceae bacterium]
MTDTAELAAPLGDIRDVLETYRTHQVLLENWAAVLSNAARSLEQASATVVAAAAAADLSAQLRMLLANGLPANTETVNKVADEAQRILSQTRIPGIPRPEDEHWAFV